MRALFLFVDGIGLGSSDPTENPLAQQRDGLLRLSSGHPWHAPVAPIFEADGIFTGLDANLGMEGLPQSGTGQVSLYTGENAAKMAGRHFGPYPHSATRDALRDKSIFARVARTHGPDSACFANAYPQRFFDFLDRFERWPATTRACLDAGVRLRTLEDLARDDAAAADITGEGLASMPGSGVIPVSPSVTAERLFGLANRHVLTVFEIFHTDKAGHARDGAAAARILDNLSEMLSKLLELCSGNTLVLLTSDHGNLEELSVKTHTRNPVPFAAVGPGAQAFAGARSITDVAPILSGVLGLGEAPGD